MRRLQILLLIGIVLLTICSVFVHPFGKIKTESSPKLPLQGAHIETPVLNTLERSCWNCHSEQTSWPWYSYVAPVSWMVEKDVRDARSHFNMSRWDEYSYEDQTRILAEISVMVKNHEMPLPRYLFLHPDAKLSTEDVLLLDQWGHAERKRVKAEAERQSQGVLGEANTGAKDKEVSRP